MRDYETTVLTKFYFRFDLIPFTFKFTSTVTRTACADFTKIVASNNVRRACRNLSLTNHDFLFHQDGREGRAQHGRLTVQ